VIAKEIGELPGKRFAVIVDEAHSSQSGESTKSMKAVLASSSLEEAERDEAGSETPEEELENIIIGEMEKRGRLPNVSTFARVAVLYAAGELFACRHCNGLAYESQQENPMARALSQAQKLRRRLGGSPCTFDAFPGKPPRMHWRIYRRLAGRAEKAEATFHEFLKQRFPPLERG
jgi:hypothetical protein